MDLSRSSLNELLKLKVRVESEIKKRGDVARRDLLKKMHRLAADHGMSLEDVVGKSEAKPKPAAAPRASVVRPAKAKASKVPPKYRNPENSAQTWTGRGRKPLWVQAWISSGRTIDELLIPKE